MYDVVQIPLLVMFLRLFSLSTERTSAILHLERLPPSTGQTMTKWKVHRILVGTVAKYLALGSGLRRQGRQEV